MSYSPYSSGCELGTYYDSSCIKSEPGKIRGVAFVRHGVNLTGADTIQWWYDMEYSGLAVVIPNVLGSHDGSSVEEDPGGGDVNTKAGAHTYALTYRHKYRSENWDFYRRMKYLNNYEIWWSTELRLFRSGAPVSVRPTDPVEEGMDTRLDWLINVNWVSKTNSIPVPNSEQISRQLFKNWKQKTAAYNCLTPILIQQYDCPTLAG